MDKQVVAEQEFSDKLPESRWRWVHSAYQASYKTRAALCLCGPVVLALKNYQMIQNDKLINKLSENNTKKCHTFKKLLLHY